MYECVDGSDELGCAISEHEVDGSGDGKGKVIGFLAFIIAKNITLELNYVTIYLTAYLSL